MATFRAENVGFRFALATEGFIPAGEGRVSHPTLRGRNARKAYQRAWTAATIAAKETGVLIVEYVSDTTGFLDPVVYFRPFGGPRRSAQWA